MLTIGPPSSPRSWPYPHIVRTPHSINCGVSRRYEGLRSSGYLSLTLACALDEKLAQAGRTSSMRACLSFVRPRRKMWSASRPICFPRAGVRGCRAWSLPFGAAPSTHGRDWADGEANGGVSQRACEHKAAQSHHPPRTAPDLLKPTPKLITILRTISSHRGPQTRAPNILHTGS